MGNGGDVNLTTETLELENVAVIDTSVFGTGNGGDINVNANSITLTGNLSTFISQVRGFDLPLVREQGKGNGGNLNINTDSISFDELTGILLDVQTGARGNGGDININATGNVDFINEEGFTFVLTQLGSESIGSAGNININAGSFAANPGSLILSDTQGIGNAGNISITAENDITFSSTQIQSQTINNAVGDAGDINIVAGNSFIVGDGSLILADTQAEGNGGKIVVNAGDRILLSGF